MKVHALLWQDYCQTRNEIITTRNGFAELVEKQKENQKQVTEMFEQLRARAEKIQPGINSREESVSMEPGASELKVFLQEQVEKRLVEKYKMICESYDQQMGKMNESIAKSSGSVRMCNEILSDMRAGWLTVVRAANPDHQFEMVGEDLQECCQVDGRHTLYLCDGTVRLDQNLSD